MKVRIQDKFDSNINIEFIKALHGENIEKDLRNRVYCMHLDENFNTEKVLTMGFNIAKQE